MPTTEAGKAVSSLNSIQHGILARTAAIPGVELLEDWQAHRDGVIESLTPTCALELCLAERTDDAATKAIYALPPDQVTADLNAVVAYAAKIPAGNQKVVVAGFWNHLRSMITGRYRVPREASHEKR